MGEGIFDLRCLALPGHVSCIECRLLLLIVEPLMTGPFICINNDLCMCHVVSLWLEPERRELLNPITVCSIVCVCRFVSMVSNIFSSIRQYDTEWPTGSRWLSQYKDGVPVYTWFLYWTSTRTWYIDALRKLFIDTGYKICGQNQSFRDYIISGQNQ